MTVARPTTLPTGVALDELIVCPTCDAIWSRPETPVQSRAVCSRCGTTLIAPRRRAGETFLALASTALILIVAATLFPFLTLGVGGLEQRASVLETAFAFTGPLALLSVAVVFFIVVIPAMRLTLLIYVLGPITLGRPPRRHAKQAFRLAEALLPWSMVEIFAISCAVALVKLTDLAEVSFGPAVWMFAALVILVMIAENLLCRYSIWRALAQ